MVPSPPRGAALAHASLDNLVSVRGRRHHSAAVSRQEGRRQARPRSHGSHGPLRRRRLRPRGRDLVQVPLAARQLALAQRHHARARGLRPGRLCPHLHRCLPRQHGGAGGRLAAGEAAEELLGGAHDQLDDLAVCADGQLQARPAPAPAAVRQRHQHWVELLSELLEQLVRVPGQCGEGGVGGGRPAVLGERDRFVEEVASGI